MKWNRELNPAVVGIVCVVGSLVVLDQSLRLVFRPGGTAVASVHEADVLAELPTTSPYERLAAVKAEIRELEQTRDTLNESLPTLSEAERGERMKEIAVMSQTLSILREEEERVTLDLVSGESPEM